MFHVSRETFFCFTENCFSVKQKTKVKTEKIIEKLLSFLHGFTGNESVIVL